METAYQSNLVAMRSEWQSQLETLSEEVRHKQALMTYQAKSKEVWVGWVGGGVCGGRRSATSRRS